MFTSLMPVPKQQYFAIAGIPLIGGKIFTYAAGTNNPKATYTDSAGTTPQANPIILNSRGEPDNAIYWSGAYKVAVQDALGNVIYTVDNYNTDPAGVWSLVTTFLTSAGAAMVGFIQAGVGAVLRTVQDRLRDTVSVKDFGAIGTAVPGNVVADTAAFMAALATGKNVVVPQGTYYVSTTMNLGYAQGMRGSGRGKTVINYTGSGDGIFCGSTVPTSLIYDIELSDFSLNCSNKVTPVNNGIRMENCVYFSLDRLSIFGAFSPNVPEPLVGNGLYLTNNSILGRISNVSCRQWNFGYYLKTLAASPSYWTAGIVIGGQGELANNMFGLVVGDPTISFASGSGLTIRDMAFQGNYSGAVLINSGDTTIVDSCYFESNGNYDVTIGTTLGGSPVSCKVTDCYMSSESIAVNPYASTPYTAKIIVVNGSFTAIRDNNMSVTSGIPLVRIAAACNSTSVTGNRLNSLNSAATRIVNNSATSIIDRNYPNQVASAHVGTFSRTLADPNGNVSYTGVGFTPSSISFNAAVDTAPDNCSGFTDGTTSRCLTSDGTNAQTSSANCIKLIRPTAADTSSASLVSFDADGFTLAWAKTGAPSSTMTVNYIAYK